MIEGIFEFCMSSIYSIGKEPFKELIYQYTLMDKQTQGKLTQLKENQNQIMV